MQDRCYKDVPLSILDNLCEEVILGQDFMRKHKSAEFDFGGDPVVGPDRCHGFQETYENCQHKFSTIYEFCSWKTTTKDMVLFFAEVITLYRFM